MNLTNAFTLQVIFKLVEFDEIKCLCAFTKYTTQKCISKPQPMSMSLVHLILNAET